MTEQTTLNRCRLVLVAGPGHPEGGATPDRVAAALAGGDVASLILVQGAADVDAFQSYVEAIAPGAQAQGVAVIIAGDSRVAGRVGADGIHLDDGLAAVTEAVERHSGKLIVGAGGAKTRHDALDLGEVQPDYIFFGRFGYDTDPTPHPRNLGLAEWWAEIVELPCIVQGGGDLASVEAAAATGAEFVALSHAIFAGGADPAASVAEANATLDRTAPRFED